MEHTLPAPWKSLSPYEVENACKLIGKDWMLICAGDASDKAPIPSAMTASWGCMGVLWNKPVCVAFIRPQRHTYTLTESHDRLSFAFFDDSYRDVLRHFGAKSGRDEDKFAATRLTRAYHPTTGTLYPAQARLVLFCRKLYTDMLRPEAFLDSSLLSNYEAGDFHRMYVCEIEEAWRKA